MKKSKGFTLIEAIVVVAILGILTTIAWHFYSQESVRNRRTEAITALTKTANDLEEWKADTGSYANFVIPAAITNNLVSYAAPVVTLDVPNVGGYTISIVPTGAQATNDQDCTSMSINNLGNKTYTGNAPDATRCWGTTN